MGQSKADPAAAWHRYREGSGPLHTLTVTVAKAIHEERHPNQSWERDLVDDQWLAVGSWQTAEAVVAVLPLVVTTLEETA